LIDFDWSSERGKFFLLTYVYGGNNTPKDKEEYFFSQKPAHHSNLYHIIKTLL